jgi:glycosyltransferase involved in cell wall biosynthesis
VVTTDAGGMAEVVTDGVDGLVVPRRDPHALARAFAHLARDPDRRRRMGAHAWARSQDFALEPQVDAVEHLLEAAAANRRGATPDTR